MEIDISNEDCIAGLSTLEDKSVDFAFSDPPYNVGKDYGNYKDNMREKDYLNMIKEFIHHYKRITKKGFAIYTDWKHLKQFWDLIPEAEPIIIFKRSSGVISSPLNIVQNHYIILITAKCLKKNIKSMWDNIRLIRDGYLFNEERYGNRPAQTSLKATKRIIEYFTEENDYVVDCFNGIGTTSTACKQLNRNFIGFDINEDYCKIAKQRIKQETVGDFLSPKGESLIAINQN